MKGSILIIGGVVITGAVAYGVYRYIENQKDIEVKSKEDNIKTSAVQEKEMEWSSTNTTDINSVKKESASSIKERREEATQIIKESMNTIYSEVDDEILTENTEVLEGVTLNLDNLLK